MRSGTPFERLRAAPRRSGLVPQGWATLYRWHGAVPYCTIVLVATKDRPRSTRFDFSEEERDRLEFLRRRRGDRSAAAALRALIFEASNAAGYSGSPTRPAAPSEQPLKVSPAPPEATRREREEAPSVAAAEDVETVRRWLLSWEEEFSDAVEGEEPTKALWREATNEQVVLLADMADDSDPYEIALYAAALGVRGEALGDALGNEMPVTILAADIKSGSYDRGFAAGMVHVELRGRIWEAAGGQPALIETCSVRR
ncbi:hypothetical protein WME88_27625 [Sorangium sp. So ce216]